jgi:hypothetical protein
VPEQRKNNDDRDRHAQKVKQNSAAHGHLLFDAVSIGTSTQQRGMISFSPNVTSPQ